MTYGPSQDVAGLSDAAMSQSAPRPDTHVRLDAARRLASAAVLRKTPRLETRCEIHVEVLFEFIRESNRAHFQFELRTYEGWGVEAQFWMNGEYLQRLQPSSSRRSTFSCYSSLNNTSVQGEITERLDSLPSESSPIVLVLRP